MSCGQYQRETKLGVRLAVAQMVLASVPGEFDTMFPKVMTTVMAGVKPDELDQRPGMLTGPALRNAMLNAPARDFLPLGLPDMPLGSLLQAPSGEAVGLDEETTDRLASTLAALGLSIGMSGNALRDWIMGAK